jgi:hypothetical protein
VEGICRGLSLRQSVGTYLEEPEGNSGANINALAKIHSKYIRVKYYKVYRFGSLVLRKMSDKECVGVSFIGAILNLLMRPIIGFRL